jgi:hypothetical protein
MWQQQQQPAAEIGSFCQPVFHVWLLPLTLLLPLSLPLLPAAAAADAAG